MSPRRQALVDAWRERVQLAARRYETAMSQTQTIEAEHADGMASPEGSFAYRQTLQSGRLALAEYQRVLRIFTDLVVRGKIPEPDQG